MLARQPDLPLLNVLFNWDNIPSQNNDDIDIKRLRVILKEEFAIDWIDKPGTPSPKKDGTVLSIFSDPSETEPKLSIKLNNDDASKATRAMMTFKEGTVIRFENFVVRINQQNGNSYIYYYKNKEIGAPTKPGKYLVYLDVWERHITALDDPGIRESALGGPDTATRLKIIWQVKILSITDDDLTDKDFINNQVLKNSKIIDYCPLKSEVLASLDKNQNLPIRRLRARLNPLPEQNKNEDMYILPATSGYKGLENHLYRVEIHEPTVIRDPNDSTKNIDATFKFSVDNAAIVSQVSSFSTGKLKVKNIGKDKLLGFNIGQWVEIIDDRRELSGLPGSFIRLIDVDANTLTLAFDPNSVDGDDLSDENFPQEYNPKARRWDTITADSKVGSISIKKQPSNSENFISLGEEGVQVEFVDDIYRTGDYWLIPAGTAGSGVDGAGDIEWPRTGNAPDSMPPEGVKHHFSPLALINYDNDKKTTILADCRRFFPAITNLASLYYVGGDGQEAGDDGVVPFPLMARVSIGNKPMPGLKVHFETKSTGAILSDQHPRMTDPAKLTFDILTDANGFVQCNWKLDTTNLDANNSTNQQVVANLVNFDNAETNLPTLIFHASYKKPARH